MTLRAPLAVALALVGALPATATAAAGGGWSADQPVAGAATGDPGVAIGRDGTMLVAYPSGPRVRIALRLPGGSWQTATTVEAAGSLAGAPVCALASRTQGVCAFVVGAPAGLTVQATRIGPSGAGAVQTLAGPVAAPVASIDVASDPTGAATVLIALGGTVTAIATTADGFGPPTPLAGDGSLVTTGAQLAADARGIVVAAWRRAIGTGDIVETARRAPTGVWSAVEVLADPGTLDGPSLAVAPSGSAVVVWHRADVGVEVRTAPPDGPWAAAGVVGTGAFGAPQATIDDVAAHILWVGNAAPPAGPLIRTSSVAGAPWAAPQPIAGADAAVAPVLRAVGDGRPVAAFASARSVGLVAQPKPPADALLSRDQKADVGAAAADADGGGNVVVAWRAGGAIRAAFFDAAPPTIQLRVAKRVPAGAPIPYRAFVRDVGVGGGTVSWRFGDRGKANGAVVKHAYRRPGRYTVRIQAVDAAGNVRLVERGVEVTPPAFRVLRARVVGDYVASLLDARLALALTGPPKALVRVELRQGTTTVATFSTRVKTGKPTLRLTLPEKLLPGRYRVIVSGRSGGIDVPPVATSIRVAAPPEGIASRWWASATENGEPVNVVPAGTTRVNANWELAVLPVRARALAVYWILPSGRATPAVRKPRATPVTSFVEVASGLPPGLWRAVLRAGPDVIATVRVRVSGAASRATTAVVPRVG